MYKVKLLPIAGDDLRGAILYILDEYEDTAAADALVEDVFRQVDLLAEFPYAHPLYQAKMKLPGEFRFFPVRNYIVFYTVVEPEHIVEIRRVLYAKMDIAQQNI